MPHFGSFWPFQTSFFGWYPVYDQTTRQSDIQAPKAANELHTRTVVATSTPFQGRAPLCQADLQMGNGMRW